MHKHPEHETKDKTELAKRSLVAHFAQVPDPRINLRTDHDLIDILVIAVCTLLCAGETFNDMEDFGWFQACLSGSQVPQNDPNCADAHLAGHNYVDQADMTRFRHCLSGAGILADPSCAN